MWVNVKASMWKSQKLENAHNTRVIKKIYIKKHNKTIVLRTTYAHILAIFKLITITITISRLSPHQRGTPRPPPKPDLGATLYLFLSPAVKVLHITHAHTATHYSVHILPKASRTAAKMQEAPCKARKRSGGAGWPRAPAKFIYNLYFSLNSSRREREQPGSAGRTTEARLRNRQTAGTLPVGKVLNFLLIAKLCARARTSHPGRWPPVRRVRETIKLSRACTCIYALMTGMYVKGT